MIFNKETVQTGSQLVSDLSTKCVHLIALGKSDSVIIASIKDNINEIWAELLELIETRKQLLKAALNMHRFVNDCRVSYFLSILSHRFTYYYRLYCI